jgi:hypothetical protein
MVLFIGVLFSVAHFVYHGIYGKINFFLVLLIKSLNAVNALQNLQRFKNIGFFVFSRQIANGGAQ